MDPLKQRHIRNLDGTHDFHSLAERDLQSAQEASTHSPSITSGSVHRKTSSNNAVDCSLESTADTNTCSDRTALAYEEGTLFEKDDFSSDFNRILDVDDFTDCYRRTDFAPRQVPFTPVPTLPYNSPVRRAETISPRQHCQGHEQKQPSVWHHLDWMATGRFINVEPAALQQQQTTILRPALFSLSVPSNATPTVFALASSVPNPIINQLSMNLLSQPTVEQDLIPFKTPRNTGTEPSLSDISSRATSSIQSQHDASQQVPLLKQSCAFESISQTTQAAPNSNPDRTKVGGKDDEIHPIFESAGLAEGPVSPQSNQTPHEATGRNLSMVHPPWPTTLLTPSTNSNKTPVHDKDLDPCYFKTKADQQQKAEDNQVGNNNTIGSKTTAIEFAPMKNNDDHKASIQSREERLLRDGHIRLTLPLDGQTAVMTTTTTTTATAEASTLSPTAAGLEIKAKSSLNGCVGDENGVELSNPPSSVNRYLSRGDVNLEAMRDKDGTSSMPKCNHAEKMNGVSMQDKEESIECLIESMDWTKTGLGPRSGWQRELTVVFQVMLKSSSPYGLYWGDKNYLLYNDALRPILRQKHPR
ncbi:hypothetical protein BGZ98_000124, partial [Dissophora globulifera]